jgi:hypothetical protein
MTFLDCPAYLSHDSQANLTGGFKTAAIASLPLHGIETIVDVGGADGTVLETIHDGR